MNAHTVVGLVMSLGLIAISGYLHLVHYRKETVAPNPEALMLRINYLALCVAWACALTLLAFNRFWWEIHARSSETHTNSFLWGGANGALICAGFFYVILVFLLEQSAAGARRKAGRSK